MEYFQKYNKVPVKQVLVLLLCTLTVGKLLMSNYKPRAHFEFLANLSRSDSDNEELAKESRVVAEQRTKLCTDCSQTTSQTDVINAKSNETTESELGSNFVLPVKKSEEWMKSQELLYAQRKERIHQVCREHRIKTGRRLTLNAAKKLPSYPFIDEEPPIERPNRIHAFLLRSSSVMACNQPKVASSSVVLSFLLADNNIKDRDLYIQRRDPYPLLPTSVGEFKSANETYFKFMFVRHPMDRLLSAYLGKVFDIGRKTNTYFAKAKKVAQAIMASRSSNGEIRFARHRRQTADEKNLNETVSNVSQMLDRWERDKMKYKTINSLDKNDTFTYAPTFEEFLEFILSTDLRGFSTMEGHWTPYWRRCSPCHIPYDVIGKTETSEDDFTYIWQRTGLDERIPIPWLNKKGPSNQDTDPRQFYAALPRDLIVRVYQRYRLDFQMFDYSINDTLLQAGYTPLEKDEDVKYSQRV